jgi:hypothetical protein
MDLSLFFAESHISEKDLNEQKVSNSFPKQTLFLDGISSLMLVSKTNSCENIINLMILNYAINSVKENDSNKILFISTKPIPRKIASSLFSNLKINQMEQIKFKFISTFEQFIEFFASIHLIREEHFNIIIIDNLMSFCDIMQIQTQHARILSLLDVSIQYLYEFSFFFFFFVGISFFDYFILFFIFFFIRSSFNGSDIKLIIGDSHIHNQYVVEYHIPVILTISETALNNHFRLTLKTSTQHNSFDQRLCLQFLTNQTDSSVLELKTMEFSKNENV